MLRRRCKLAYTERRLLFRNTAIDASSRIEIQRSQGADGKIRASQSEKINRDCKFVLAVLVSSNINFEDLPVRLREPSSDGKCSEE